MGASGLDYKASNVNLTLASRALEVTKHAAVVPTWVLQGAFDSAGVKIAVKPARSLKIVSLAALSVFLATSKATRAVWAPRRFPPSRTFTELEQLMAYADPATADAPNAVPAHFAAIAAEV